MTKYERGVAVERLTVSIDSGLAAAVREAAVADEQNASAWLAEAARRRLANRGLRDVVAHRGQVWSSLGPRLPRGTGLPCGEAGTADMSILRSP